MEKVRSKVLVVDDEPSICRSLSSMLSLEGYQVSTATSGATAVSLLQTDPPDILITDLAMPEVNGLDLVAYCAEQRLDTAVIIMTGYWSLESAVSALRLGAYDYVLKPFELPLLLAAVSRADERRYLLRQLEMRKQLDVVTTMARTISHEINNPLGVILGLVQLHLDDGCDAHTLPERLRADLETIEASTLRIKLALRKLVSLSALASTDAGLGDGSTMLNLSDDHGPDGDRQ